MVEKKFPGHYCKVCGMRKSNESFSGKGHAAHICKSVPAFHRHSGQSRRHCADWKIYRRAA